MELVIWILVSFGLTAIISISRLFRPIQNLGTFFRCPQCIGFWVGLGLAYGWKSITGNIFLDACLSSGVCLFLHTIMWKMALSDKRY